MTEPKMSHSTSIEVLDLMTQVLREERNRMKERVLNLLRTDGHPAAMIACEWNDAILAAAAMLESD